MQSLMEDLSNPAQMIRPYTRVVSKKQLATDSQCQSIEMFKKCLTIFQKGKAKSSECVQVLLERVNLVMKIIETERVYYDMSTEEIHCQYSVSIVGDIGPLPLILRASLYGDSTKNMKEGYVVSLTNLRLIANKEKPQLLTSKDTRMTSFKPFKKRNHSKAECLVSGLVDIESLDAYKKLLELKRPPSTQPITDVRAVLRWPISGMYRSDASKANYTKFRLRAISQLPSKSAALIGRVASTSPSENSLRVRLESVQSHDFIHVFVKGIAEENEVLLKPGRIAIFSSLELKLSTQGSIYAMTDFSLKNLRVIGNMSDKALERIRQLAMYPLSHIMEIIDTCAIRNVLKLWVDILQVKHMQLWNACSVCEARLEKTDFCPANCKDSRIILKGKAIVIVQDGTGKALMFLKDRGIPGAFSLDEEKIEMVKGWIRGQGEFNLVNKQKPSWNEIWSFFAGCEMRRIVALCCPFCKGVTKAKDEVESIPVPMYIKSESSAEIYINGEIQGGVRGAKGLHDICLKVIAILEDEYDDMYQQLIKELNIPCCSCLPHSLCYLLGVLGFWAVSYTHLTLPTTPYV
eukprot:TRINITY_DN1172_c0_g1_i3.p1 TRINITY_DN1172_c0_g1~~TRINITY_DN1172_c0_g1_i3.p1  ORF type:complete len:575 (-),score=140.34 TRINITY_DN1172_c0_g1_i3:40-1764(-)